jgi:hypothetical protein
MRVSWLVGNYFQSPLPVKRIHLKRSLTYSQTAFCGSRRGTDMMTPEQIERNIDFILSSHASSVVRMDRLEANLIRLEEDLSIQKENLSALMRITDNLLKVSRVELQRRKNLEGRVGSVEEMTRVLRELLEASLRRPDRPDSEK